MLTVLRLLFLFTNCFIPIDAYFGLSSVLQRSENNINSIKHHVGNKNRSAFTICKSLGLEERQFKICMSSSHRAETLENAFLLSQWECLNLFKFERWKCDYNETYRIQLIKTDLKESSFLFALSAATLVHSVATACANKSFDRRCGCYSAPLPDQRRNNKENRVCGDNLPYAKKFVRRFLQLNIRSKELHSAIMKHNINVGIKAVIDSNVTTTRCFNESCKNCCLKVKLTSFHKISKLLKKYYKNAVIARTHNSNKGIKHMSRTKLVYATDSPNFCNKSPYSPGVEGRICTEKNCDKLCCGRDRRKYQSENQHSCCQWKFKYEKFKYQKFKLKCVKFCRNRKLFKCD